MPKEDSEGNLTINKDKVVKSLKAAAEASHMDQNTIDGLTKDVEGKTAPLSGLSSNSWLESKLIGQHNRAIVDVNTPGGMFIQMSSIAYNDLNVRADGKVRDLKFDNKDGSIECCISINLLKTIIPDYDKKSFIESKEWLIKHGIIGRDTKAGAIGYRIPAQGPSSVAALKIVDVYPENIGDTITLPDEWTALTGSDFDIDKLYIARYNYDSKGNKIKVLTDEEYYAEKQAYTDKLRKEHSDWDDETIVKKVYDKYGSSNTISKKALQNRLLDLYIASISNPLQYSESKQPLDAVTSYLTDKILKDIDNLQSTEKKKMPQLYNATPGFQNKTKADLIAGKTNLGAVALGNSHHMLAQSVNLTQKVLKEVAKLNISNLSGIYSQQPNYHDKQTIITLISDWISAMVNAHVDVAKDPYINRLNVRKFTINTTNFLLRAGKGESTFYFLSQKILRDAADKFEAYSGSYGVEDTKFGASSEAKIRVREEYSKKAKELLGIDDTELKERIKDVYLNENPFNIDYLRSILPTKDTGEWYVSQLAILDVYDKIEPYARALSELTKLSQIDTKKYGNNFALQQNFLIKMAEFSLNNKTFPNPLSVIKNTFLRDKLINGLIRPRKYLGNIFVRTTEAFENKRREIYKILGKDNATMSDEFINNVTRMMEASYKTDFWINYAKDNGIKVGSLLTGDNSIPKRLYKIKQKILQNPGLNLTNSDGKFSNALLDNINMMIKTDAQMMALPDFIQFKQNKSDDHNLDDHIIRAWEELLDLTVSDSELEPVAKEIREFARDLAIYSFFTSGDAFGRNNIFKYVPNSFRESSGYYDYIRRVEENPSEYISKIRISEILKNLWWSDEVVPPVNVFKQTFEESEYGFSKVLSIDDNVATNILPSSKNIKVNGRNVNAPSSFTLNPFKFNKLLIGKNNRDQLVYTPFVKINIGPANNPLSTEIYRFYGIRLIPSKSGSIEAPVYVLDSKKGLKFRGCFLAEPASEYSSLVKTNKNLKYAIKDSNVTKNTSFNLYSNDPYNNMGEIEYLEKVLNSTTNNPSSANTSSKNQDNNVLPITKIISGGQTGVDTIGLQVAKELGIETGGTITPGFVREKGVDSYTKSQLKEFGLEEISSELQGGKSGKEFYLPRTEQNVLNSDGTVYFATDEDSAGKIATEKFAKKHGKPFLLNPTAEELRQWIAEKGIQTLNVAGNRGSKLAKDNNVANILREALSPSTSVTESSGLNGSSVPKTVSFNDINNTDNTNNESGVSNEEQTNNSVTNSNTSEVKSFDNFVKEAGDAFDEATVNKVKEDLSKQTTSSNTRPSFTFKDGTTVTTDFELNDQQKFALWELEKFYNSDETVFSLQGYAGTGKTTIMKVFDKYLNNWFSKPLYVSPTHKANAVTRANNPEALVKTIHSLLGLSPDYDVLKDSFDLSKIKFSSQSGINNTVQGTIIIVDESSMLEDSLADHLVEEAKKNGNRIIFIGDPAQLSPVGQTTESKALNYSGKVELTKVERTGDNAILKDATSLRENNTLSYITDLNDKGDGIIYTNKPATLDFFLKNIVNKNNFKNPLELRILTGENKYIPTYNKLIRNILFGENAPQLVKGDILMGYSNEKRTRDPRKPYEIINSGDYIVDEISDLTEKVVPHTDNKIKVFGYKVSLKNAYDNSNVDTFILDSNNNANSIAATQIANLINNLWSVRGKLLSEGRRKEASKIIDIINSINNSFSTMFDVKDQYGKIIRYKTFDYAYTQTVHKSQGATYNNVVVLEDTFNKFSESEKQKLKYVALTRAKHKVLYYTSSKVNNRDITDVTSSKIKEMQNNAKRLSELGKERQNECK